MKIYNVKKVKTEITCAPLKLIKIKNPFGFLQSSPPILAEQVEPIFSLETCFRETLYFTVCPCNCLIKIFGYLIDQPSDLISLVDWGKVQQEFSEFLGFHHIHLIFTN